MLLCVCVWFLQLVPSDFFGPNFCLKNFFVCNTFELVHQKEGET